MATEFRIPLAYTRWGPSPGEPFTEASFTRRTVEKTFRAGEVALVLVDIWNLGWGPAPLVPELGWEAEYERGKSNVERMRRITLEKIVPALEAARHARLTVVHLNLPEVAARYPRWRHMAPAAQNNPAPPTCDEPPPAPRASQPAWPPEAFAAEWRAEHQRLVYDEQWLKLSRQPAQRMDIPEPVRPVGADVIVANGDEMHDLLRTRRACVLFYAGFNANMCVLNKTGAIKDMARRGYRCALLRDATSSMEVAETVAGEWTTRVTVSEIERHADRGGFTALTRDFIAACRDVVGD